ncbi:hypothetical protein F4819DRAFT_189932 [Hypoxylon fuscum]|nr:hypothetical protein F4819DRAFT_189932 [Hypoxylon fuscum]
MPSDTGPEQRHRKRTVPKVEPSSHWSEIEDTILKRAVAQHGVNRWDDVARLIWSKGGADECRARWAELVPLLHDEIAGQGSDDVTTPGRTRRSMTVSASTSGAAQQESYFQLPPPALPDQRQQILDADLIAKTVPSSPASLIPSLSTPTAKPPLPPPPVPLGRTRSNTEPPTRTVASSLPTSGGKEWLAPHPLMPGRYRGQGRTKSSQSSRNTSLSRGTGW